MPRPKFDADRAAAILVDAEIKGTLYAAKTWSVSEATISRYRARLETDADLQGLVREKRTLVEPAESTPNTPSVQEVLADVLKFLQKAAREANHKDPEVIHAVMGGYKVVKEVQLAEKSLDAYLSALTAGTSPSGNEHLEGHRRPASSNGAQA